ncbi:hypothetical protein [Paraburkholderia jirisanensis]
MIDRLLFIHQRALANHSSAATDQALPSDVQADFIPFMPVLYPNAPQFHNLSGDDAVALVGLYDSLHELQSSVTDWYDRPTQLKVNIFNVMLHDVDQSLKLAQICVTRFDIDVLYPAKHETVGTTSARIERCLGQSANARENHIKRFNEQQQEEQRQKNAQGTANTARGVRPPRPSR